MRSRRTIPVLCTALATVLLGVSAQLSGANCSELKIFGSRVTKMIVAELGPQFERASGYTPVVVADVAAVMKRRIESDEPFDLAVLVDFQTDALIKIVRGATESTSWKETLSKLGWSPIFLSGDAYKKFVDEDTKRVGGIIDSLGIKSAK